MATRRSLGLGGEREFLDEEGDGGGLLGGDGSFADVGYVDPPPLMGDDLLRKIEGDRAAGAFDNDIAGNIDKPRDLRPQTPNTLGPPPPPQQPFGLPQGVSVNESMSGGYSQDAPAMPQEPSPAAGRTPQPSFAQSGSPTPGPTRRTSAPSALFGEQGSSQMFGRAGGLLGGGYGVPGAGADGEVDPTEMFKKLLQQFGQA